MSDVMQARAEYLGRALLHELLPERIIRKAYERLDAALDAERVKVFQYEGTVVADVARPDWETRMRAIERVTKLADHEPNRFEVDVSGEVAFTVVGLDEGKV